MNGNGTEIKLEQNGIACSVVRTVCGNFFDTYHISVQHRVAITLWVLATPSEYRSIAHLFGVARCTVCCIVKETCRSTVKILLPKYICFPVGNRMKETVEVCF